MPGCSASRPCAMLTRHPPPEATMPDHPSPVSRRRAAATMLLIAWAADRKRSVLAFGLFGLQALVQSLFALWLKLLLDGIQTTDTWKLTFAAAGMAASIAGST